MTVITDRHRDYTLHTAIWKRCRDALAGEDAIKQAGENYLPKLEGQTDPDYEAYKMRSRYFGAFAKTVSGLVGLTQRKPILIDASDGFNVTLNNIDRQGANLQAYLKSVYSEVLEVGRCGTLIDFTKVASGATLAEASSTRPYWVLYKTEDILDWEYSEGVLIYVVLRELIDARGLDSSKHKFRYRTCEMKDGVYVQTLQEEGKESQAEEIIPQLDSKSLTFIPFTIHSVDFVQGVKLPPLLDLVNLTLSHYRLKADQHHALHYAALPTPWITGSDPEDDKAPKTIGPQQIWHILNIDAKVGMLEFTGAGIKAIKEELDSMEDQMAILGTRVLLPEVSENTATASKLRSISETSELSSLAVVLGIQTTQMVDFTAIWSGLSEQAEVAVPTTFLPKDLDAQMLGALVNSWISGAIDHDILIDNMKQAELVAADKDAEEIMENAQSEEDERIVKVAQAMAANEGNKGEGNGD